MSYKVKAVIPEIKFSGGTSAMEAKIESVIAAETSGGWELISMESVNTTVTNAGCFGFGAKASQQVILVLIFKK